MGKYINFTSKGALKPDFDSKCASLIEDGAVKLSTQPKTFQDNLVCVVDNGMFAAAGYCYDEQEFEEFTYSKDTRTKAWFIWDKVKQYAN